jgi:hypothetical protein
MRKLLAWVVVTVGIAALVRRLRRRGEPEPDSFVDTAVATPKDAGAPQPEDTRDPADELRRKLASARDEAGLTDAPAKPDAAEAGETVDALRADVHEQGRAAIDEMQRSTEE